MRKSATAVFLAVVAVTCGVGVAGASSFEWSLILHPSDVVAGESLQKLQTRHHWKWEFDDQGKFEIAVRKSAFPVAAPQCHMDYLILGMPLYYPENPKQAAFAERRAVYDALLAMQSGGKGTLSAHVEPLQYARQGRSGPELTSCNIYFVLPLDKNAGKLLP
jgi:hypothetical protein